METWKQVPIDEFKTLYKISDMGRVYSVRSKKYLAPKISKAGYYRVNLANHGKNRTVSVHRLVALAFLQNPNNKPTVNHKNEIKTDNRVDNLEWATTAEQNIYGTRTARAVAHTNYTGRKIDYKKVAAHHDYSNQLMCGRKPIRVWDASGNYIGEFPSQKAASDYTGVSKGKISQCAAGYKKSCKGYVFRGVPYSGDKNTFP